MQICVQSLEKVPTRAKRFFNSKFFMVIKNAEFHADFKSVEKVYKKCIKKVISRNMTEICTFSVLRIFVKLVLLITVLVH